MSKKERISYTDAVKCLYSKKPPLSSPAEVPGARNRFDDFVAAHIQQGQDIHFDGYLFAWHRHFVWVYEQALRKECGYKGPTPYWDWTLSADDPRRSPVFDGSATSMSGNGETIPHGGTFVSAFGLNVTLPPGTGGGCVKDGPFANLQVRKPYVACLTSMQHNPLSPPRFISLSSLTQVPF
jgi:tyrosinase